MKNVVKATLVWILQQNQRGECGIWQNEIFYWNNQILHEKKSHKRKKKEMAIHLFKQHFTFALSISPWDNFLSLRIALGIRFSRIVKQDWPTFGLPRKNSRDLPARSTLYRLWGTNKAIRASTISVGSISLSFFFSAPKQHGNRLGLHAEKSLKSGVASLQIVLPQSFRGC